MGTRGSPLALAQSGALVRDLIALTPGLEVETVIIKTSGDLFSAAKPDAAEAPAGGKGLFVKEIEEALSAGRVDFAVHSSKDLPAVLAPGLEIAAYPRRADPRDVFIGKPGLSWTALGPGHKVGTASLRRRVQLLAARPGVETVPMRGNVDTRLRKLSEGLCDGIILAAAGLERLGRSDVAREPVPVEVILPSPGQGALAVEVRSDRAEIVKTISTLDDPRTRREVELERAFLSAVGGNCATPLGAFARVAADGSAVLEVFWSRPDGTGATRLTDTCPAGGDPAAVASRLTAKLPR